LLMSCTNSIVPAFCQYQRNTSTSWPSRLLTVTQKLQVYFGQLLDGAPSALILQDKTRHRFLAVSSHVASMRVTMQIQRKVNLLVFLARLTSTTFSTTSDLRVCYEITGTLWRERRGGRCKALNIIWLHNKL
jgi:hypothetical protein